MFKISKRQRCYIIAEIGGNFVTFEEAKRLVDLAAVCRVDAVKLQTYRADTLAIKSALFDMENTGVTSQYDLFKKYEISEDLHKQIFRYAKSKGLDAFSTPSHQSDAEMLSRLGSNVFKIGSDDAVNIPFLKYLAKLGKPLILSTGMCTMKEVRDSVRAIQRAGNKQLALLHAVTCYPTHAHDVNLLAMKSLMREFPNLVVGYSDHTLGNNAALAAVSLGAKIIEKHFTFDRKAKGPDHILSADPKEMRDLVKGVREIELILGDGVKRPARGENITRRNNRKSIVTETPIEKGERLTSHNVSIKRPGKGIEPKYYEAIIGKKATRRLAPDILLSWKDFH